MKKTLSKASRKQEAHNVAEIPSLIYEIRGHNVMLDSDLAGLYGVSVKALNQAVKRNLDRFPPDFMFKLTDNEWESLRCQIGTSNNSLTSQIAISNDALTFQNGISNDSLRSQIVTANGRGGRRTIPYAFTEEGVAMLSGVLRSPKAVEVNIAIMRAFVQMRRFMLHRPAYAAEIKELKQMLLLHIDNTDTRLGEHGERIDQIIQVLNNLIERPTPRRRIGFNAGQDG